MAAVLTTGNQGTLETMPLPAGLPANIAAAFSANSTEPYAAMLIEGDADAVSQAVARVAGLPGPIVSVHVLQPDQPLAYQTDWLLEEVSVSINTTAAGGNASLMMIS
jgi:RHH-type proline utilization regulon transcriptional repressor/proline dehydrogenase/delta 1-pyrroline-5-carboxylate dehydrogenase